MRPESSFQVSSKCLDRQGFGGESGWLCAGKIAQARRPNSISPQEHAENLKLRAGFRAGGWIASSREKFIAEAVQAILGKTLVREGCGGVDAR